MPTVDELISNAKKSYEDALKLLETQDYYDAAEKIWASVKTATMALTLKFLGRSNPPEGVYWRDFIAQAFVKAGLPKDEAEKKASYYIDVRDRLHGACFYGMIYEEIEHKPLIEKAKEYISSLKELIKRS